MRDGTDTRVERTRAIGDAPPNTTGPGLVAAAVLARQRASDLRTAAAASSHPEDRDIRAACAFAFDRFADRLADLARLP